MSTTSYSSAQLVARLREQIDATQAEATSLERLQRGIDADVKKIEQEIEQAWSQLAETVIPAYDGVAFDRAAALLRLPAIAGSQVERRVNEQVTKARASLAQLTNDPLVADRDNKINEAQIRRAEIEEAVQPLQGSTSSLEAEPYFEELLAYRYGTEAYAVKFFQLLYYTHWKNADVIVEKYGPRLKAADFGALAAKYVDEKTALRQLLDVRKGLDDIVAVADERARQVAELEQGIAQAVPRNLALVRARVREHLEPLADADVAALLLQSPTIDLAWRRIAGLRKKQEYLQALAAEQVVGPLGEIKALRTKLVADTNKLMRPKNVARYWPATDWDRRFQNDRAPKWQKRRERIQHTRSHIVQFHHYDRWNPTSDLLWWDVMSDGQLDGNFIHEVRSRPHHHHHQTQHHDTDVHTRESFADVS